MLYMAIKHPDLIWYSEPELDVEHVEQNFRSYLPNFW